MCVTHTGSRLTGFPKSAHAPYYSRCPKPSAAPAICPRAALGELGQSFTEGDYAQFLQQVNEVGAFRRTSETPSAFRSGSSGCVLEGFRGHQCPQNYFFRCIYFKPKSHISKHSSPDFVLSLFSIDLMPFSLIHPPPNKRKITENDLLYASLCLIVLPDVSRRLQVRSHTGKSSDLAPL